MQRHALNLTCLLWKEIVHFFREPSVRSIYLLLPALSAPIIFLFGLEIALVSRAQLVVKPIRICIISDDQTSSAVAAASDLKTNLLSSKSVQILDCADPKAALDNHNIDATLTVSGERKLIEIESNESTVNAQLTGLVTAAQGEVMADYFTKNRLDINAVEPFSIAKVTTKPSPSAMFYQTIGAVGVFFSLLLVGNVTAILTIGEFDYHTIETTLMQPSRRLAVVGKTMAAAFISVVPGTLGFLSFFVPTFAVLSAVQYQTRLAFEFSSLISIILAIYMTSLFAAFIDFGASILMKGAKLSSATTTYINGGLILLACAGYAMPTDINLFIAAVPVLNVCSASRAIITGESNWISTAAYFAMLIQILIVFALTEPLFTLEDAVTNLVIAAHKFMKVKDGVSPQ